MSKRQVVVLWILALVLAAAAFIARSGDSKGFESKTQRARGATLLADFPVAEVAKVQISSGEKSASLARKDGKWVVANREDYPANTANINDLLRTIAEVKVTDGIEADPSFAPRFGMDPDATDEQDRGTEVVLSNDAGTELARLTLGKNLEGASDPMSMMGGGASGRFVRNHADDSGVYKVSEIFPSLSPEPQRWLDQSFLKVEKIKSVSVSPSARPAEVAWKVTRPDESSEFTLEGATDGETLDTTATSPLKSLFSYSNFSDVVALDEIDDIAKPLEKKTVKIETFEGFNYTLTVTATETEKPDEEDPNAAPPEESFLMTVEVTAEIPAERKKEENESEDDAKAKDQAFTDRKAELEKRLATEKAFAGRTFKVSRYVVEAVLKERSALIKQPEAPATTGTPAPGGPATVVTPPVATPPIATPPVRRPVEAVTPPIAIPPLEEDEAAPAEDPAAEEPSEEPAEPAEAPPAESE